MATGTPEKNKDKEDVEGGYGVEDVEFKLSEIDTTTATTTKIDSAV
jgi:hypothetical protein